MLFQHMPAHGELWESLLSVPLGPLSDLVSISPVCCTMHVTVVLARMLVVPLERWKAHDELSIVLGTKPRASSQ